MSAMRSENQPAIACGVGRTAKGGAQAHLVAGFSWVGRPRPAPPPCGASARRPGSNGTRRWSSVRTWMSRQTATMPRPAIVSQVKMSGVMFGLRSTSLCMACGEGVAARRDARGAVI
eukprot:scaffold103776_cov27-Tisochrysis_lutea.AAC.2